jgi:hypothetical protein
MLNLAQLMEVSNLVILKKFVEQLLKQVKKNFQIIIEVYLKLAKRNQS